MNDASGDSLAITTDAGLNRRRWRRTLFAALLDGRKAFGGRHGIVAGADGPTLTFDRLVLASMVLGRALARQTMPGERVGLLLPNVTSVAAAFFALIGFGRVPAMLNFSAGIRSLLIAATTADIETVVTSRSFARQADLENAVEALSVNAKIVYLEDVRAGLTRFDKLRGFIDAMLARSLHNRLGITPDDIAVMLFTSGSEGDPKGVALTHANLLANCEQFLTMLSITGEDRIFNALPVFHSFGLTTGLLAPIVIGMRTFLYPSPLHYKQIPPLVRQSGATILTGTDTFAAGWARAADPAEFASLRLVFLGAEKVKDSTRALWRERFGLEIFEGYGATEAAPVIAANTLDHHRDGAVGKLMPGLDVRLEPVTGIDHGGRLYVRGPNVMAGYMRHEKPGVIEAPADGWHDTGDIVTIDDDGFVFIRGRAKRFAKIGGEMVSLAAVEAYCSEVWPDNANAVAAVTHPRKGETLVLVTDRPDPERTALLDWAKAHGVGELMIPKTILTVEALPVMGTGKIDYPAIQKIAAGG
jgi:acyl-[acyl-carrier-protein]-phospholipid O-acyltransferase/long-chain-fatty-acid--[acyl-carrier-protein] ligase